MNDLPERLEKWATDKTAFLSFRENDLLFEAAETVRTLRAEVEVLRANKADNITVVSRSMADACSAARFEGRVEAAEACARACDEAAREYLRRADLSVSGMSFEREWRICADAAHGCAESIRGLLPRARSAAE